MIKDPNDEAPEKAIRNLQESESIKNKPEEKLGQNTEKLQTTSSKGNRILVSGINIEWTLESGTWTFENLPVTMMWVDTTLAGLMSGVQTMVGTERFALALQSEGRKSVEGDWLVISQYPDFHEGFKAIANIAGVAGWGQWVIVSQDKEMKECRFRVRDSWEGLYQRALGVCWGSAMLAGKMAGYCSKLFETNCWADQTAFIARGEPYDEFVVRPSPRSIEKEIESLLASDEATRADMAVALRKLEKEIAERNRIEEALRENEAIFSAFLENSPVYVFFKDKNIRSLRLSKNYEQLLGIPIQQALGKSMDELFPSDLSKSMVADDRRVLYEGQHVDVVEELGGRIYETTKFPILKDGTPYLLAGFTVEVTERKRVEQALRESEERFRATFEQAAVGIAHVSPEGRVKRINQRFCDIVGFNREEMLEREIQEITYPADLQAESDLVSRILADEIKTYSLEKRYRRRDGSLVWVNQTVSLLRRPDGAPEHLVSVVEDITERKQTEEALKASEEKYKDLYEEAPMGYMEFDHEGRITKVN